MWRIQVFLLIALVSLSGGCLTRQVAKDGVNFRQSLLDMYTDQIMDNLIRASQNRPFVQLAYRNLIVTDVQADKVTAANEADPTNSRTVAASTSAFLSSMRNFTDRVILGATAERDRTMQFLADPVTGKNDIYEYYTAFASDPELFCTSTDEPTCAVHIKKKCEGKWYWVPANAGGVFLELSLKTTFMRGPQTPPPIYWESRIASVAHRIDSVTGKPRASEYVITFFEPVPNDQMPGFYLTVDLDGCRELSIPLMHFGAVQYPIPPTNILFAQYNSELPDLTNRRVKVFAPNMPNLGSESPAEIRLDQAVENYRNFIRQRSEN
jgi:hypothetical protein